MSQHEFIEKLNMQVFKLSSPEKQKMLGSCYWSSALIIVCFPGHKNNFIALSLIPVYVKHKFDPGFHATLYILDYAHFF